MKESLRRISIGVVVGAVLLVVGMVAAHAQVMVYAPAPVVVQRYGYQNPAPVPPAVAQGRNPCSAGSGVANVVVSGIVGAGLGALFGDNHRAAGVGAGLGALSGGANASYECREYLAWVAANTPRTNCTIQRTVVNGQVISETETCTSQETRVGYGNWK